MGGIIFLWLIVRLIDTNVMTYLMAGDWQNALNALKQNIQTNYAGAGASTTYSVVFALAILTYMLRFVGAKSPVRGVSIT
jgi:hypothetical protein